MAIVSTFVPEQEIRNLTRGSYEQLVGQVDEAIRKESVRLFGADVVVETAATFKNYAIALTEDRQKAFRVRFETNQKGEVVPIQAESIAVPLYTEESWAVREAKRYVDSFFSGARTEAAETLKALIPHVRDRQPTPAPSQIVETFALLVQGERGWKTVYTERLAQIRAAVKDDIAQLDEKRLRPKFARLQDGSINESDLKDYAGLVTSDLKYIGDRAVALLEGAQKAAASFATAVPALKTAKTDETVKVFQSFTEDYIADLAGVTKALSESSRVLNRVDQFAKIYDVLADELHRYEVAGRFIEKMSCRLAEASTEER